MQGLFQEFYRIAAQGGQSSLFDPISRELTAAGLSPSIRPWAGTDGVLVCALRPGARSRLVLDAQLPRLRPGLPDPEIRDHALVGAHVLDEFPHLTMAVAAFLDLARLPETARPDATLLVWSFDGPSAGGPATTRELLGLSRDGLVLGPSRALPFQYGGGTVVPVEVSVHGQVRIDNVDGSRPAPGIPPRVAEIEWPSAALVATVLDSLAGVLRPHERALGWLARQTGMEHRSLSSILQRLAPDLLLQWHPAGREPGSQGVRLANWPLGCSLDDLRSRHADPGKGQHAADMDAVWSPTFLSPDHSWVRTAMDRIRLLEPGAVPVPLWRDHHPRPCWYQSMTMSWLGLTPVLFPSSLNGNAMLREPIQRCPISGMEWGRRTLVDLVTKLAG